MNESDLLKLQEVEFEMLKIIDEFCREYNIQYSLYAGTALGAVRHKGFIPWDDDIDIAMSRDYFNLFCSTWNHKPIEGYTLSCLQYDDDCATCHAKLHKDDTIYLSEGEIEEIGNHGIWIDIFPLDKVGDISNQKKVFFHAKVLLLLSRSNTRRNNDNFKIKTLRLVFAMIPKSIKRLLIDYNLRWMSNNNNQLKSNYNLVSLSALYAFKYRFPSEMTEKFENIEFNGEDFCIFQDYKKMLSIIYGDYMILPPENERVLTHTPIKIKF